MSKLSRSKNQIAKSELTVVTNIAVTDSDEGELPIGVAGGNWGKKARKGVRWVRRGKAAAWGLSKDEWKVCSSSFMFQSPRSHILHFSVSMTYLSTLTNSSMAG